MSSSRIAELFKIQPRFLRSANLERDFADASALQGYIPTPQAADHFGRLALGLAPTSGQRAWRITGDYGVGKSSFALVLAHALGGGTKSFSPSLREAFVLPSWASRHRLVPVLVTGTREPVSIAVLRALSSSLEKLHLRGRPPKVLHRIQSRLENPLRGSGLDADAIRFVEEAGHFVRGSGHGGGLLLILDELGKFLEYAALNPDRQDIYFLQTLAETASRSGDTPLVVVGLLHQGFSAYADRLSESAQREWQKVAGRFEELVFDRPLEQTAGLIADAIGLDMSRLPRGIHGRAKEDMAAVVKLGWYGPGTPITELANLSPRLYPVHPTVLPVLSRLFSRHGQNERSLFSFLLSSEPFGIPAFAHRPASPECFYRLHDLYDYARAVFGHRLSLQSYRSHWNLIESVVESFAAEQATELRVLKTVAVLNLIDDQGLMASAEALELAVGAGEADRADVRSVVERLKKKHVLYYRGISGGFCLWPHTSVNIENAYTEARKAIAGAATASSLVADEVDTRPIVARRHYITTGNLRHFDVHCCPAGDLPTYLQQSLSSASDGAVLLALCETAEERARAIDIARSETFSQHASVLVAVSRPLEMLKSAAIEVQRWAWVLRHTSELTHDRYAAEEVSRQLANARRVLRDRIEDLAGFKSVGVSSELEWYCRGSRVAIGPGRELLARLSKVCDQVFSLAPKVRNELVNRRELSSAAASARMRLIERLFSSSDLPYLGMDIEKKPPEMSMYLSVLKSGRMHIERGVGWAVAEPEKDYDPLHVWPTFDRFRQLLTDVPDGRVKASVILDELRKPPFGVRDGLTPLLLAVFAAVHRHDLAFYEDGTFVRDMTGTEFLRLTKNPMSFELQLCRVSGVRATLFAELAAMFAEQGSRAKDAHVLDVVRPLCTFAAQLPQYTRRTTRIPDDAKSVRAALIAAREPAMLLFRDLPVACGLTGFAADGRSDRTAAASFVKLLRHALDVLRGAYPALLDSVVDYVREAFDRRGSVEQVRRDLAGTAGRLLGSVHEVKLKGLCLRLTDQALGDQPWVEALAGFITGKPPAAWTDNDVDRFREDLGRLAAQFRRVEATMADGDQHGTFATRVSVTMPDGTDVTDIIRITAEEEPVARELEEQILRLIRQSKRAGLAAASRVLSRELLIKETKE